MQMGCARGDGLFGGEFLAFRFVNFVARRTEHRPRRIGFKIHRRMSAAARADNRNAHPPAPAAALLRMSFGCRELGAPAPLQSRLVCGSRLAIVNHWPRFFTNRPMKNLVRRDRLTCDSGGFVFRKRTALCRWMRARVRRGRGVRRRMRFASPARSRFTSFAPVAPGSAALLVAPAS